MKTILTFKNLFLVVIGSIIFSACSTNVEEPMEEVVTNSCKTVSYASTVKSIIDANCIECHSQNGGQFPNLDTYNALSSNANSVLSEVESRRMPIGGSLTTAEITSIKCWVQNGALNN